jgi:lysophospholipase L1-like esterase
MRENEAAMQKSPEILPSVVAGRRAGRVGNASALGDGRGSIVIGLLGGLVVLNKGSAIAPFIHTLSQRRIGASSAMMHRLALGAATMLFSCLAVAAMIEGYVRLVADDGMQYDLEMWKYARDVKRVSADPLIGHEHRPNRHATLMGVSFDTNSKGLRDREFAYGRRPGTLRILMLGDSLVVGWGVPNEQTFVKRVERLYRNNGVDAEVINAGVGNYNTIQEVEYFTTEGYEYQPDIVVLNFFVNDAEPVPVDRPPSLFGRLCYSCVFIAGRFDMLRREALGGKDWADYYLGLYDGGKAQGWFDAKAALHRLAERCRSHDIKLLVASLPDLHQLQPYRLQSITDLVHRAADEDQVAFADMLPYLRDQDPSTLWVTPPDPHPNALADKLIAAGLFDALQELR